MLTLKRDPFTSAVINSNEKEHREYRLKLEIFNEIKKLQEEVNLLKLEIVDLKKEIKKANNV